MILLGAYDGALLWLVIAGAIWLYQTLKGAVDKGGSAAKPKPPITSSRGGRGSMRDQPELDPEEERTRKFLEALGLPPDAPRPRSSPTVLRPTAERKAASPWGEKPVPPIVAAPRTRRAPDILRPKTIQPPMLPPEVLRPATERSNAEDPVPRAWEQQAHSIEQVQLPTLAAASVPEYQTYASRVSAIPGRPSRIIASASKDRAAGIDFRELVRNSDALRQAIILSEILGPPRSLQSFGEAPSLRLP